MLSPPRASLVTSPCPGILIQCWLIVVATLKWRPPKVYAPFPLYFFVLVHLLH
jgi:hypothetical protein